MSKYNILEEALQFSQHDYAIIDRALIGNIENLANELPLIEMTSPVLEHQAHLYPYLLSIGKVTPRLWQYMCNLVNDSVGNSYFPIFSILYKSSLPPEVFRSRLVNILIFKDDGGKNYSFRFYDPKVFIHMFWIFSLNELAAFSRLTDISVCSFLIGKEWYSVEFGFNDDDDDDDDDSFITSINNNLDKLKSIKVINNIIRMNGFFDECSLYEYILGCNKIYDSISLARKFYKMESDEDLACFSSHYLNVGTTFYQHPKLSKILEDCVDNKGSYHRLVNNISNLEWNEIQQYCLGLNK